MERFDYDPDKSRLNEERHGIDFVDAQTLWDSTHIVIPAKNIKGENRSAVVGKAQGKYYVAIFTMRNEVIRIISCHRADKRWINIYEEYAQKD